jgi:hypothetical protein
VSRNSKIPTENHLLLEANIGLKVGYSPTNENFFINKEVGDALLALYYISSATYSTQIHFDLNKALSSPSCFRTAGIGKINTLAEQLGGANSIEKFPLFLMPSLPSDSKTTFQQLKQCGTLKTKIDAFNEAYQQLAAAIDDKRSSLPLSILQKHDVTLAYYYGSRIFLNLATPLPITEKNIHITFSFIFHDKPEMKFEFPIPSNRSEIVFDIGILPSVPQTVDVNIIKRQQNQKPTILCNYSHVPLTSAIRSTFFTCDFTCDFYIPPLMSALPKLKKNDPKTVLGLIRYEQFYNKHKKLLLQVGDGTSLKEAIRLYYHMYIPDQELSINLLDDIPIPVDGRVQAIVQHIANTLNKSFRLYQCDSYGQEVRNLPPFGNDLNNPVIEVVQDVISSPNIYFLVVDPTVTIPSGGSKNRQDSPPPTPPHKKFSSPTKI